MSMYIISISYLYTGGGYFGVYSFLILYMCVTVLCVTWSFNSPRGNLPKGIIVWCCAFPDNIISPERAHPPDPMSHTTSKNLNLWKLSKPHLFFRTQATLI